MNSAAPKSLPTTHVGAENRFQAGRFVWDRIAASQQFQHLIRAKRAFIIPAFLFFLAYCLSLPLLAGYAPHFMSKKVIAGTSVAYLFALSQFIVGWVIVALYVRAAARFDQLAQNIARQAEQNGRR